MDETQQYLRTIRYRRRAISIFLTAVFGLIVALGVLAIAKINELQGRFSAQNTSKGFSICLHQYHDDYKCFPMAAELENGKSPKHSWRALIEPYFKQFGEFPIAYNKKVAWDAEDNLQAPKYHHSNISSFRYLAVTGPNTVINSERPVRFKEITDDTSNTLMAIAIRKTGPYFTNLSMYRSPQMEKSATKKSHLILSRQCI